MICLKILSLPYEGSSSRRSRNLKVLKKLCLEPEVRDSWKKIRIQGQLAGIPQEEIEELPNSEEVTKRNTGLLEVMKKIVLRSGRPEITQAKARKKYRSRSLKTHFGFGALEPFLPIPLIDEEFSRNWKNY